MLESKFNKKNLAINRLSEPKSNTKKEKLSNSSINTPAKSESNTSIKTPAKEIKVDKFPASSQTLRTELIFSSSISKSLTLINEMISQHLYQEKSVQREVENQQKIAKKEVEEKDNFQKQMV